MGRSRFSEISEKTMPHTPETHTCNADRKKSLLRWCWILFMLAAIAVAGPMAAEKGKPLVR